MITFRNSISRGAEMALATAFGTWMVRYGSLTTSYVSSTSCWILHQALAHQRVQAIF